jgi:hypothetical protein
MAKKRQKKRIVQENRKKKKYWLIGGEVGAIIGLLICLVSMLTLLSYNSQCNNADNCMIDAPQYIKASYQVFSVCSYPIIEFINSGKMFEISYIILGVLILILEYFIIGAIIGWIYGVLKKK